MPQLPPDRHLPIHLLIACFNNTVSTYKFYWLLAIIQAIEAGSDTITKRELFSRMISSAWYTVNYFHVSFGKQDELQRAVKKIRQLENIPVDAAQGVVLQVLLQSKNPETLKELRYFNNQVPHWFLSPWFPGEKSRASIYHSSKGFDNLCPYALRDDFIQVNLLWGNYLRQNAGLIKDFCYWNLVMFLQGKNPSVPDIPGKIIKPAFRGSLSTHRTKFWDIVIRKAGPMKCIYTGKQLEVGNYAVEHFIPHNFVSHDLIWNLIPADKSFNCTKSDKLPSLDKYFDQFYIMQEKAVNIISNAQPQNKFLQDYLTIFSSIDQNRKSSTNFSKQNFRERIEPLITIASNNGFEFLP